MSTKSVDLDAVVRDAHELEPLPQSALRLAGLLAQEDWDLVAVQDVVRYDEALTGRLLSAANSARSGARAEIASVEQAVVRLGVSTVLSVAVGAAVQGRMRRALPALGLDEGQLWRHSVASALAVELARPLVLRDVPPHAFVSALLHDVGKLVLERHVDDELAEITERARVAGKLDLEDSERAILHVSHAEVGALVVRAWKLPECIATGILHHHRPLAAPDEAGRFLATLLQLADAVAHEIEAGCGCTRPAHGLSPEVAGALGLPLARFQELCERTSAELDGVLALYGS